ncbi:hypothetical protein [Actinomyces culturomici]|uniref:hypothetical protein n=1 Tax=Actinomyces culturomici TaxID=1926276 RepID=UPI000E205095|nr:hypothetical protein [Actinomyces culturomici]
MDFVDGVHAARVAGESTTVGRWSARLRDAVAKTHYSNWVAVAGETSLAGRALQAGRGLLKGAGVVGGILTGWSVVDNGYEQVRDDSIDPSLTGGERVARAATHGLLEGGLESVGETVGSLGGAILSVRGGPAAIGAGFVEGGEQGGEVLRRLGGAGADAADSFIIHPLLGKGDAGS